MIDKRIINALLIVDIGVVLFCYFFGTRTWLINSQIGFLSSILVVLASMHSYSKMVQRQVDNAKPLEDEGDIEPQEEVLKEEQKISVLESLKNSRASISLYRIGAYGVFALGFLYLSSHNIFHIQYF
ncbi:MAG: hypothetical protein P8Y43_03235 [Sulfurovaceae bacterium]